MLLFASQSPLRTFLFASAKSYRHVLAFITILSFLILRCTPSYASGADAFVTLSNFLAFTTDDNFGSMVFGLFMGVMLTASAYLFFIWIVMHDRGQVFLLLLLVCLSINIAGTNEALMDQLGFHSAMARMMLVNYSLIFSCIFGAVFSYFFLEIDINLPWLGNVVIAVCGTLLALLLIAAFSQSFLQQVAPLMIVAATGTILMIGVLSFYQRISGSLTHIIAFLCFLCGMVAPSLYELGLLASTVVEHNMTYLSFSMAAMMFAIVTASQFAARQEEKEKALAISNERFMLATRGANEGLFDWNLRTGDIFFSEQLRKILGQRLENSTVGLKRWIRMVPDSDRRIVREALRRFRHSPDMSAINIEYRIKGKDDTRRWMHTKAVAVRDNINRHVIRLVGSTSDVTARKQSEVALRASELRFRSITEAHPVPVMIVGLRNEAILYASPSVEQLLNVPQDKILFNSFAHFLPDDTMRLEIWEAMSRGREINLKEVRLLNGGETLIDAALSARRISYQNEEAMVIGLYDLTERKQAEEQIARQQEALQQSEKMAALGGLLAGVAHELNNPLSVVVGQAALLMEGSAEPKVVTRADKIYKAADRCARIVKSFLALARRKPAERKPMDLNSIIHGALDLLGYQIRTSNTEVVLDLGTDLAEVSGDADQMTQVITNLVLNATQAMLTWDGTRRITIRTANDNRDGESRLMLLVSDTGPGVPVDLRTRIFEPFFTTKSGTGGTGVGLSLCLNIVASHGGQLTIDETEGGGATFTILLPATQKSENTPQDQEDIAPPLAQKLRILLVDDEVELAQTLADLLEPDGCDVDIAVNGAIALDKLHKNRVDVIVSDLRMPVLDGPGLYEALGRELPLYQSKIIYVTGDTLSTHVQAFLKQYPHIPVIEKPYRVSDVRRAIENLVKGTKDAA